MRAEYKAMAGAFVFGLCFWVLHTVVDYLYFYDGQTFTALLITAVPPHEIFVRLAALGLFLVFGAVTGILLRSLRQSRKARVASEAGALTTLKSIGDAVITTDVQGTVQFLNKRAEILTGWTLEEACGRPVSEVFRIVSEETGAAVENPTATVLQQGVTVELANHTVLIGKDGSRYPIDDSGAPIRNDRGQLLGAVLVFSDISERRQTEARLVHLGSVLEAIRNVNQLIVRERDRDRLIQGACDCLIEARGYEKAWIALTDTAGEHSAIAAAGMGVEETQLRSKMKAGTPPSCWPLAIQAESAVTQMDPDAVCGPCGLCRLTENDVALCVRLTHADKVYGFLTVVVPGGMVTDPEELSLVEEVGADIAFALHSIELQRERQRVEQRFQLAAEVASDLIYEWDVQTDTLTWHGDIDQALGFDPGELPRTIEAWAGLIHPDDQARLADAVERHRTSTESISEEYRIRRKDGDWRFWSDKGRPVLGPDGLPRRWIGTCCDVTDQRLAEQELRTSEAFLSSVIDQSPSPSWISDENGTLVRINRAGCELLRISEGEVIGKYNILNDNMVDEQGHMAAVRAVYSDGKIARFRVAWDTKKLKSLNLTGEAKVVLDATMFPIRDETGRVTNAVIHNTDVTERVRAEEALRESEERYRAVAEDMPVMICRFLPSGEITYANRAYCDYFDTRLEELVGRTFLSLIPESDRENVMEGISALTVESPTQAHEHPVIAPGGETRWHRWTNRALFDDRGNATAYQSIGEDITERRLAEEALRERESLLNEVGKIAKIGGWEMDLLTRKAKWTQGTYDIVEIDPGQPIPGPDEHVDYYLPGYRDMIVNAMKAMIENDEPLEFEAELQTAKGNIKWCRAIGRAERKNGECVKVYGTFQDITERKLAEMELRDREEKLRTIIEHSREVYYIHDTEHRLTYMSPLCEEVFGYPPEQMMIVWMTLLTDNPVNEKGIELTEKAISTGERQEAYLLEIRRKDGEHRWIEVDESPVKDASGKVVAISGALRDVSVRRRAQEALAQSEERYRFLADNASDTIWTMDMNLNFTYFSPAVLRQRGLTPEEAMARSLDESLTPESCELVSAALREELKIESRQPRDLSRSRILEVEVYRKDGSTAWAEVAMSYLRDRDGNPTGILGVSRDITERKKVAEALANERERLAVTLRSIGDGVIATDRQSRVTLLNDVATRLTGCSEQDALGKPLKDVFRIINEQTRESVPNPVDRVIETGIVVGLANHTILIAADGSERAIADSGAPIRDQNDDIIGVVLVFRDVTETRRLQDFAVRAQRLETAGRIAGQVAHDFNNLLAPLMAYPSFIKETLPANSEAAEYVDKIESAADQMAEINQQLLTLGRRGHYAVEALDINSIVMNVAEQMPLGPDTLIVETDLAEDLMPVKGGASQIFRVIANLSTNALDAMQDIGQLTLRTQNFYLDDSYGQYGQIPKGEYVKITVSDTGAGIPQDVANRIFEPFFTTKTSDRRRGSGLGLSVVHAVIEDHYGFVDFDSVAGRGTSFYIYLPVTRERVSKAAEEHITGGHEQILVVDDDQIQRDVTVTLLEKLGYRATAVESGEQAIEFLLDRPQDLLVLDMIMPGGIDGTETYRRVLEMYSDQRAIIVSGYAESDRVREATAMGAGAFVRKPLTLKTIARAVRKELDRVRA